ncbi:MAG TPA: PqiC family protein, partial [Opitutales bacterium]|nr:PqiC family protein [Opitutales bacterium]
MHFPRQIFLVAAIGLLAGCTVLDPKPDYSQFYLLNPLTAKMAPAPQPDPTLRLIVDDTEVPEYLNRPQMVARLPGNQVSRDEYHRWGEPLNEGFSRVLAQDIALLSDSSHVASFPIPPGFGQDLEINVQLLQFDGALNGTVT